MSQEIQTLLRRVRLYRRLSEEDRRRLAEVARVRRYPRGETLFSEGDRADVFHTLVEGRVKVFKVSPAGKDVILEIFGPEDPLGAVAVYEERPYPATAVALEDTVSILIPRHDFFDLLDRYPSLVRGLLLAMTWRLVDLTNRLTELTGGRIEPRLARLFLKLGDDLGQRENGGVRIPLSLSRQELADLTGTTIETAIRIMSRWGKNGIVTTENDGFVVRDRDALEALGME